MNRQVRAAAKRDPDSHRSDASPGAGPALPLTSVRVIALAALLLLAHVGLATLSLVQENATVDEVAHLPAGISYWKTGSFKLYHHNPPLIKLLAALPVVLANPVTTPLYQTRAWTSPAPSQIDFAQYFAALNADRYFELFTLGRLVMPWLSALGGLLVLAWSWRLHGPGGGLLSLSLWCLAPNILAHARLVTTDLGGTVLVLLAMAGFWHFLRRPSWQTAAAAGLALGLAQLAKFSALSLYVIWPLVGLCWVALSRPWNRRTTARALAWSGLILGVSLLVINLGYGFEGTGRPIGQFSFASDALTRPGHTPGRSPNPLLDLAWRNRVNRFRGSWLGDFPAPLPAHFLLGFDEQRLETEALPLAWFDPTAGPEERTGYPVYLDGTLQRTGWRTYYLRCLLYKLPEGTWLLLGLTIIAALTSRHARLPARDELALLALPVVVFALMTFATDINLGLRYILPLFPFAFIAAGRLVPWAGVLKGTWRRVAWAGLVAGLLMEAGATLSIHPHYLAYFNWASGGPANGSRHLIDSNLDWGQDLVGLDRWLDANAPDQPVGLAYFGQINPSIFNLRAGQRPTPAFNWFLPPVLPGSISRMASPDQTLQGPAPHFQAGLYAISASLVRGLPWRLNDPAPDAWMPAWKTSELAFTLFADLVPEARIGYSIFIYRLTAAQAARLNSQLEATAADRAPVAGVP